MRDFACMGVLFAADFQEQGYVLDTDGEDHQVSWADGVQRCLRMEKALALELKQLDLEYEWKAGDPRSKALPVSALQQVQDRHRVTTSNAWAEVRAERLTAITEGMIEVAISSSRPRTRT